jgi:membrane protein
LNNPFSRPRAALVRWIDRERERYPWFDHLARAGGRYQSLSGDRVAAGLTYYAFLSFFPLLAVAFSVVGFLATVDPGIRSQVNQALFDNFAGLVGGDNGIDVTSFENGKSLAAGLGVAGLLYTGLGWLSAVRDGLRVIWGMPRSTRNVALRKLDDLGLLLVLGFALLVSLTLAGFGSAYTVQLLHLLDLSDSFTGNLVTKTVTTLIGFLVDLPLFTLMFTGLSDWRPRKRVLRGAMVASLGFEALKLIGSVLLARTTANPVYATFAVGVGLLVWMYFVHRVLVFAAAWTVTGPGDDGPTEPQHRPFRRSRRIAGDEFPPGPPSEPHTDERADMRKIVVTTWVTLDGFIAGPKDEMDWVGRFYDQAMGEYEMDLVRGGDTLLLGRTTYDSFAGSWPFVPDRPGVSDEERDYALVVNAMRKVVVSSTVTDPSWEHTDVLTDVRREEIEALKAEPGKDIIVYGSASLVRQLTSLALIDEYHLLVHPVVLGEGKPLFAGVATDLVFDSATPHPSGVVKLVYRRA